MKLCALCGPVVFLPEDSRRGAVPTQEPPSTSAVHPPSQRPPLLTPPPHLLDSKKTTKQSCYACHVPLSPRRHPLSGRPRSANRSVDAIASHGRPYRR